LPSVNTRMEDRNRFIELVHRRAYKEGHFVLASGRESPYYVNGKMVTLHPEGLSLAARLALDLLIPEIQAVGGLTLGADPIIGAMVALSWERQRPVDGFIVRKEPKDHGTKSLIEGPLEPGTVVCIVEDTTTTGGSLMKAVRAAEDAGCRVAQVITLVDREEGGGDAVREAGYRFDAVITLAEVRDFKV
jgi:orotate phosphoribosyltransferase